jgi:undecaprenyl diphosphate synthase
LRLWIWEEIINAVKTSAIKLKNNIISIDSIDDSIINVHAKFTRRRFINTTSGEHRISNFLCKQIAYAELYFTDVLWPDFKEDNLYEGYY